jgi:1-acyl-sn-glycerol-3-phosphate acyltransferase
MIIIQKICKLILHISGWKTIRTTPIVPKSVICLAPHTSNWDFILAKLYYSSFESTRPRFLMKKEWFVFPVGLVLKAMGGIPVDRSKHTSITKQVVEEFKKHKVFHIGITPEGTRKAVNSWRKGFYHIAIGAGVPIQLAYLDYAKKEAGITKIFHPTGDEQADMKEIHDFYKNVHGRFQNRFNG